jgi:hypothetical protein
LLKAELEPNAIQKIDLDGDKLQKGLAKLVLAIVELLRQILERQAQRRVSSGSLTTEEVERLGSTFMQLKEKMSELSDKFGFESGELENVFGSIKLGNSQSNRASLVDIVDKLLVKGVAIGGKITISVADIDLVALDLFAVLSALPGSEKKDG